MRRAVLAFGGTVAGLILLLSFRSHTSSTASAGVSAAGTSSDSSSAAPTAPVTPSATASPSASATKPARRPAGTRVVTGNVVSGPYGPSQVAVTLSGNKITKVTVLRHTDDGANSQAIDGNALPRLTAETLAAQSAKIDAVSGASYTSAGYIKSLQSALDKA
jgi:uncharacterized protein with FMN-binding domain